MEEKEISFIVIPTEVFKAKDLSLAEKYLYGYLSIFKKQCCFKSNKAISEDTGISEPTISRALQSLTRKKYVFVEYANNNSAKRHIYVIFDNPKKLKYLASKGLFSEGNQNDEPVENSRGGNQNDEGGNQNDEPHNGGEGNQNDDHKKVYIKYSKSEPSSGLGDRPSEAPNQHRPYRSDYETQEAYEQAIYAWRG